VNLNVNAVKYDLEERLLEFAVRVIRVTESMNKSQAGVHVADQLLRAGTSPCGNHGEAEGAGRISAFCVAAEALCPKGARFDSPRQRLGNGSWQKPPALKGRNDGDALSGLTSLQTRFPKALPWAIYFRAVGAERRLSKPHLSVKRSALSVERLASSATP
jgi:hypothetical protein